VKWAGFQTQADARNPSARKLEISGGLLEKGLACRSVVGDADFAANSDSEVSFSYFIYLETLALELVRNGM
jgi:hypothetical protein